MKTLNEYIEEKLVLNNNTKVRKKPEYYNYFPETYEELDELVVKLIEERGNEADLNDIDTSKITDMSELFLGSKFNGDISEWNVSNVENMEGMFYESKFNGDISEWNVSKVENMNHMFFYTDFNGDISKWNVSNVADMHGMFCCSSFNSDISKWKINSDCDVVNMFDECPIKKAYKPKFKK
jgi:surface protein